MDWKQFYKLTERYDTAFKAVLALVVAVIGFTGYFMEVLHAVLEFGWLQWLITLVISATAVVVGYFLLRGPSSRLLEPDALTLDPQSLDQLVGRAEDLKKLLQTLSNELVFLISESGCGKTTLLRAGVEQSSDFTERFLPIYIDMSALDWEDGPLRELREGFALALLRDNSTHRKLSPKLKREISRKLKRESGPSDYISVFEDYYSRSARRPLLLLDQFDDYQAQSRLRDKFFPPKTQQWCKAKEIAEQNAFWRVVRDCIDAKVVHVIVAVREEASPGLDCIRFFTDTQQFGLLRLPSGLVRQIIDRLTLRPEGQSAVIADPEYGWTELYERLVHDLQGPILPQQLKIVLSGLRTLPNLTSKSYLRAGRVGGLEAALVWDAIERAASAADLQSTEVLRLACALVDRTRQPANSGPPQTVSDLASALSIKASVVEAALRALASNKITRPQFGAASADSSWRLDHAYLARPLLRLERDQDRWRLLLAERARIYADSDWRHRWQALLSLKEQVGLLVARLRGRLRYGEYRQFALKSLLRGAPALALLIVGYFGWEQYRVLQYKHDLIEWGLPVALYDQSNRLTSLIVRNNRLTNLRWLQCNFNQLSLYVPKVDDLDPLRGCKSLVSLNLSIRGSDVTSLNALNGLTGLTSLKLDLAGSQVTSLDALKGLTGLTSLELTLPNTITSLDPLKDLPALTSLTLDLKRTWVTTQDALEALRGLTKLTSLTLYLKSSEIPSEHALEALTGLSKRLTSLKLDLTHSGVYSLDALKGFTGLTSLELTIPNTISNPDPLEDLTGLTSLKLDLAGSQVTSLDALKGFTGLTRLELTPPNTMTGPDALKGLSLVPLKDLTALTSLKLDLADIQVSDLDALNGFTPPTRLVSDVDALNGLTALTSLTLDLNGRRVSNPVELNVLARLTRLTDLTLDLRRTKITNLDALRGLTHLTNLTLQIGDGFPRGSATRFGTLEGLTRLASLTLNQGEDVKSFVALKNVAGLINVALLEGRGVTSLDALKGLTGLTSLNLNLAGSGVSNSDELNALTRLTDLTLDLRRTEITNLDALRGLVDLTNLTLDLDSAITGVSGGVRTRVTSLDALKDLTHLSNLNLDLADRQVTNLNAIKGLTSLKNLTIYLFKTGSVDLESLDKLETLTINSPLRLELNGVPKSLTSFDLSDSSN